MGSRQRTQTEYDHRWKAIKRRRRHAVNSLLEDIRDRVLYEIHSQDEAAFSLAEAEGYLLDVPPSTVDTASSDEIVLQLLMEHLPAIEAGDDA